MLVEQFQFCRHSESHASTCEVLQKLDDTAETLINLLDEPGGNNDTTSNVLESFLNATGRSSIMKKTQFEYVSLKCWNFHLIMTINIKIPSLL